MKGYRPRLFFGLSYLLDGPRFTTKQAAEDFIDIMHTRMYGTTTPSREFDGFPKWTVEDCMIYEDAKTGIEDCPLIIWPEQVKEHIHNPKIVALQRQIDSLLELIKKNK